MCVCAFPFVCDLALFIATFLTHYEQQHPKHFTSFSPHTSSSLATFRLPLAMGLTITADNNPKQNTDEPTFFAPGSGSSTPHAGCSSSSGSEGGGLTFSALSKGQGRVYFILTKMNKQMRGLPWKRDLPIQNTRDPKCQNTLHYTLVPVLFLYTHLLSITAGKLYQFEQDARSFNPAIYPGLKKAVN